MDRCKLDFHLILTTSRFLLYILHFKDGTHYTGFTRKGFAEDRVKEHVASNSDWVCQKLRRLGFKKGEDVYLYLQVGFRSQVVGIQHKAEQAWKRRAKALCQICQQKKEEQSAT